MQGVRVVSYDLEIDAARGPLAALGRVMEPDLQLPEVGPYRLMMRMFQVPEGDGAAAQYILVCQAYPIAEATDEIEAMKAFLDSLTFDSSH